MMLAEVDRIGSEPIPTAAMGKRHLGKAPGHQKSPLSSPLELMTAAGFASRKHLLSCVLEMCYICAEALFML